MIDLTFDELNSTLILEDSTEDLLERLVVSSILEPAGMETVGSDQLNQKMVSRYYRKYGIVEEAEIKPVTDKLVYYYDSGDDLGGDSE